MTNWRLNTVYSVYQSIDKGLKTIDTRAPDFKYKEKRFDLIKPGDSIEIIPVDEKDFKQMDSAILIYIAGEILYFLPLWKNDFYERVVKRMFKEVDHTKVFPGLTLEEAILKYHDFPRYPARIGKNGIVAIELVTSF